jgi:hypothetical protein
MRVETLPRSIADPACGNGAILDVLRDAGHFIYGADIRDYGWPHTIIRDYLAEPVVMNDVGIVTNPPYRLALEFIEKALSDGTQYAAFLLRLNFLESIARKPFFEKNPPSRVWVSSRRLPMMHRQGWQGKRSTSNQAFGWFVFDKREPYQGPQLNFFDWKASHVHADPRS